MRKIFLLSLFLISLTTSYSQNLYPEKYEDCHLTSFCLDCGDTQAQPPKSITNELVNKFNQKKLSKIEGTIDVQILIDDNGKPCLLSSLNQTNVTSKKLNLQNAINNTSYWEPAISKDKRTSSSVSLVFVFENGFFSIKRRIFDFQNQTNMKSNGTPNVKGTKKDKLTKSWTVFTQENSELPWDLTRSVASDLNNNIWIGTDNGIVKIENDKWVHFNSKNTIISAPEYNKKLTHSVRDLEVDMKNNKWFIIGWDAYKYDNEKWTKYDSVNSPINWARTIFIDHSNNVWFTSWDGVAKFDGQNWSVINKQNSNLPTNKILGVFVDKKNRIWIGTFMGNVIIENGITRPLDDNGSPLSKAFIRQMHEDNKGNLWFGLYNEKPGEAGIYKLDTSGNWTRITHPNSKMFSLNSINDFLLDEENNSLWITLNGVGVLNYDLNTKNWETYTSENSNVPSTYFEGITKDKSGSIWIATYAGVIKLN